MATKTEILDEWLKLEALKGVVTSSAGTYHDTATGRFTSKPGGAGEGGSKGGGGGRGTVDLSGQKGGSAGGALEAFRGHGFDTVMDHVDNKTGWDSKRRQAAHAQLSSAFDDFSKQVPKPLASKMGKALERSLSMFDEGDEDGSSAVMTEVYKPAYAAFKDFVGKNKTKYPDVHEAMGGVKEVRYW